MAELKIKDENGVEVDKTTFRFRRYRKKPVLIDACELPFPVTIVTLEGEMKGNKGDWLIIGVKGEPYPCKPDIFKETYEKLL